MPQSWWWGGTSVGDAVQAPYDDQGDWGYLWARILTHDRVNEGVFSALGGQFDLSTPVSGGSFTMTGGLAIVSGKIFLDGSEVFNVSGSSVYLLVGIRADHAAQTVRSFIRGSYASRALALASLVQSEGTTWEIPLYVFLTTAGGVIDSYTDERHFVMMSATKYRRRQGANASTSWGVAGTSNFNAELDYSQLGVINDAVVGVSSGTIAVTFPSAYEDAYGGGTPTPMIFLTSMTDNVVVMATAISNTGFTINWYTTDGTNLTDTVTVSWMSVAGARHT